MVIAGLLRKKMGMGDIVKENFQGESVLRRKDRGNLPGTEKRSEAALKRALKEVRR